MTREERLYSMRGVELIAEAEKLGVKVSHKGNSLKESKEKVIQKILTMEELLRTAENAKEENTLTVPVPVQCTENGLQLIETEEHEKTEAVEVAKVEEPTKQIKKSRKKTFEELVREIPLPGKQDIVIVRAANGDVILKYRKKRVFRYNGHTLIATNEKMFSGCNYEKQNWNGYVIHNVSSDVMRNIYKNI